MGTRSRAVSFARLPRFAPHERDTAAREHIGGLLRCRDMPASSPHRRTPELPHLPVPAAPVLTHEGLCSVCRAIPVLICKDEVQICRNCLAVLWHMRRPAATAKPRPPAESKPTPDAELVVPVPSARQRAIDAVVRSPEKSGRRIAAETGLDRATIAKARGQLDEYQPVDMPRAETPQSSDPEPPADAPGPE